MIAREWLLAAWLSLAPQGDARETAKPAPRADVEALKRLHRWVGEWSGRGWSQLPGGPRVEFEISESVEMRSGGSVLLVRGEGKSTGPGHAVTHDGVVLVDFDARTRRYRWNGHDIGHDAIEVEPIVRDGGLDWSLTPEGGKGSVRFHIEFDEREWRESGDLSLDGETWTRFMAMTLERKR